MNNEQNKIRGLKYVFFLLLIINCSLFIVSCGYHIIGSRLLPFDSITIKQVQNKTYEPGLEEKLHNALSKEFINQGIEVKRAGGDAEMEATVKIFELGAIGAVDNTIKEQSIIMKVDIKLVNHGQVTEFKDMVSPIEITYQTTGTVAESVAFKEKAAEKACNEIAKEIVSRIILKYAK
jgi:hypothetical protein